MFTIFNDFFLNTASVFRLFSYRTFRCGFAMMLAFIFIFLLMPKYIAFSHKWQNLGQPIREEYLPSHASKKGTPTAGGIMLILATIISVCFVSDLRSGYVLILLFSLCLFGLIGFIDDYKKIKKANVIGIRGKTRFLVECLIAFVVIYAVNKYVDNDFYSNTITFPFFRKLILDIGVFYTLFRIFVIVGTCNAVNLTDGLDGLAVQEICIFISASIGALLGFLWYNAKPAQIFMGDTGSLAFGGTLGVIAVILKCEFLLAIVGGLFVIETLSDILQVMSFKLSHGKKRLFKMAPLHHHFEKSGWSETQIVIRFWIISILFACVGLASLKLR